MGDVANLMPELVLPTKVRKIRAPKHDFKNGEGKVFAHRHSNGGGWVADTAYVAETVKVSSGCGVYGFARVTDNVTLSGRAMVGDRARVMHNARLSNVAHVRGSALVRDSVNLTDRTFVAGQAHLSGNTFTQGKVYINDFAVVHNTRCNGPNLAYNLEICGNAKVFDCTMYGPSFARDTAILENAHLSFSGCAGAGKIINATVNTHIDGEVSIYAYAARRRRRRITDPEPTDVPSLQGRLVCVYGLVVGGRVITRPVVVGAAAYVLNCTIVLYNQDLSERFPEFPPGPIVDLNTNTMTSLLQYYQRGTAQTAAASPIPVIASVGAVPTEARQRRIMRMEETA